MIINKINATKIVLLLAFLITTSQSSYAQYAYGLTAVEYDSTSKQLFAYSGTALDYYAGYYYDPAVGGSMYKQGVGNPISNGFDEGFANIDPAEVYTDSGGPTAPNTWYDTYSDHYIIAYYYTSVNVCDDFNGSCWYDPYGYSFFGGGSYPGGFNFFGAGPDTFDSRRFFLLGVTGVGVLTPPADPPPCDSVNRLTVSNGGTCPDLLTVDLTSANRGDLERINNTTQKAMLGARVILNATPSNPTADTTYLWKVDGQTQTVGVTGGQIKIPFDTNGLHTIQVTATQANRTPATAQVTIDVGMPDIKDPQAQPPYDVPHGYTAIEQAPDFQRLLSNFDCASPTTGSLYFGIGCPVAVNTASNGILFKSRVVPPEKFISEGTDSHVKFVQIVKPDRVRVDTSTNGTRYAECQTYSSASPTGWRLDGDPYSFQGQGDKPFSNDEDPQNPEQDTLLTAPDSPAQQLTAGQEYVINDNFETYVVYYAKYENQAEKARHAIAVLPWSWGGRVIKRNSNWTIYSKIPSSKINDIPGQRVAFSTTSDGVRAFSGDVTGQGWSTACGVQPPPPVPATPPAQVAVWRVSSGNWYVMGNNGTLAASQQWGASGGTPATTDVPAPGDYDGDGKTDFAVFRPSNGNWYILNSSNNATVILQLGLSGDKPVQANYDGDDRTDLAVFRPSNNTWYIQGSSNNPDRIYTYRQFGLNTDTTVAADYDGDGRADLAIWRPSNGSWQYLSSVTNQVVSATLGTSSDKPLIGDFDGDGRSDYAVWQSNGNWNIKYISNGTIRAIPWGFQSSDIAVPGDYDSDGKTDVAVWRPSNGTWYIEKSSNGQLFSPQFGTQGDIPVPAFYNR